jgi:hypothetical protein
MAGAYYKPFNICLFWYYIKQIMNVFIRAMVSLMKNILTIVPINIHYLYTGSFQKLNEFIRYG